MNLEQILADALAGAFSAILAAVVGVFAVTAHKAWRVRVKLREVAQRLRDIRFNRHAYGTGMEALKYAQDELSEALSEAQTEIEGRLKLSGKIRKKFDMLHAELEDARDQRLLIIFKESLGYAKDSDSEQGSLAALEAAVEDLASTIRCWAFIVP